MMKRTLQKMTAGLLAGIFACGCLNMGAEKKPLVDEIRASAANIYLLGDVTRDGLLDPVDATMILRYYATQIMGNDGSKILNAEQLKIADTDKNGNVTETDAVRVLNYYAQAMLGKAPTNWGTYTSGETAVPTATLTISGRSLPLGVPVSSLTATLGNAADTLSEARKDYTLTYSVFSPATRNLVIAMSVGGNVVGYYAVGNYVSQQGDVIVTTYKDSIGTKTVYAASAMLRGYSTVYTEISNLNDLNVYSKICWYATNGVRALNNVAGIRWSDTASKCAQAHSADMAANNYLDHTDKRGVAFSKRLSNAGINWSSCAENINGGYQDAFVAVDGWYNSSGHRKNMLASYKNVGIGFAYNANSQYKIYGTQDYYTAFGE